MQESPARLYPILLVMMLPLASGCDGSKTGAASASAPALDCGVVELAAEPASSTTGMTFIKGGRFLQGAAPKKPEEGPPRLTEVSDFWIDTTEVTNAAFARFVAANAYVTLAERPLNPRQYPTLQGDQLKPSAIVFVNDDDLEDGPDIWWRVVPGADWRHPEGPQSSIEGRDRHPVVQIAYDDALAYARWLGRDLPTEAEWELAARGGLEGAPYVWGDQSLDTSRPQANVWQGIFPINDEGNDGYKARTAPVGCFPANGFGLYDMAGNVWEWTRDWYGPGLDPTQVINPIGPSERGSHRDDGLDEKRHAIKGGSFLCADNYCLRYRPPAREAGPTDTGSSHVGFRTVLRATGVMDPS